MNYASFLPIISQKNAGNFLITCIRLPAAASPPLCEPLPNLYISGDMLAVVRLPLERDIAVGVAFHEQPHDPFDKVAEVESHIKQLFHLLGVDRLVIDGRCRQRAILFAGEYYPEEVDGGKSREWYDVVVNDFHACNFTRVTYCIVIN